MFPLVERLREAPCRAWSCSKSGREVWIVETGVGPMKTQRVLDWLSSRKQILGNREQGTGNREQGTGNREQEAGNRSPLPVPCSLFPVPWIMAGFAGALQADVRVGDVVVAQEVVDFEGNRWPTSWPGLAALPGGRPLTLPARTCCQAGRLLTSPRLIGDPDEKHRLGQMHRAQAVDMESATVARFCHERGIPFGCVRSISDHVETRLSPHLVSLLSHGQVSIPRLAATLVCHPSTIGSLLTLARNTRLASLALAEKLAGLLLSPCHPATL